MKRTYPPLDPFSEVVDTRRRFVPDWYSWLVGLSPIVVTVSELPAAGANQGARAFVTDATSTTFLSVVAGGGVNKVPVVSNGTNWLIG
jgi:hypothetical protein